MDSSKTEQEKPSKDNGEHIDDSDDMSCFVKQAHFSFGAGVNNPVPVLRMSATKAVVEALTIPGIPMMGVCGKDDKHMAALLERVKRRVTRDDLFGVIVMVNLKMKPDLRIIQEEIAHELGFSFQGQEEEEEEDKTASFVFRLLPSKNKKAVPVTENARQLSDKIRSIPKTLFIFRDLQATLDVDKLGIPFGVDHQGCKLILTSESEEILSSHMYVLDIFTVTPPDTN